MTKFLLLLLMTGTISSTFAQRSKMLENLKKELAASKEDTAKVRLCADISDLYGVYNEDSCLYYTNKGLKLLEKLNYPEGKIRLLYALGLYYTNTGDLPKALKSFVQGQQLAVKIKDKTGIAAGIFGTGVIYDYIDPRTAITYMMKARKMAQSGENSNWVLINRIDINLGICYMSLNQFDSAFVYLNGLYKRTSSNDVYYTPALLFFGSLQSKLGHTDEAINLLKQSVSVSENDNDHFSLSDSYYSLADVYDKMDIPDSAIRFAQKAFENAELVDRKNNMLLSANLLAKLYEPVNLKESYRYLKIAADINNEIYGLKKTHDLQKLVVEEQQQQLKAEQEQVDYKNKLRLYLVISGLAVLVFIAFILYRNNLRGRKLNNKLQSTLNHLKATQSQLIQTEKMASLGELTAGIAHEIQNPLNFVNNFSEVNTEMLEELKAERLKPNAERDDTLEDELINDVIANEQKINHHGKRAGDIVKGMLQHSRASTGTKEPTDINALADEYLRLAYHGLRAKDKSFNATMKTEFDETIGNINIIPQDIGRVILNLITNAFYVVNEKKNQGLKGYEPTVTVKTLKNPPSGGRGAEVLISVKDNGNGIPQKVLDKIFQPFFTTKPTGQGTGLGLSLSYDIIKAHGGEIKVETKETRPPARSDHSGGDDPVGRGEGTEFIISLPANT